MYPPSFSRRPASRASSRPAIGQVDIVPTGEAVLSVQVLSPWRNKTTLCMVRLKADTTEYVRVSAVASGSSPDLRAHVRSGPRTSRTIPILLRRSSWLYLQMRSVRLADPS